MAKRKKNQISFVHKVPLPLDRESAARLEGQSKITNKLYNLLKEKADVLRVEFAKAMEAGHEERAREIGLVLYTERGLRNLVPDLKIEKGHLTFVHSSPLKNVALRLSCAIKAHQDSRHGRRAGPPVAWPRFHAWKREWTSLEYDEARNSWKLVDGAKLKLSFGRKDGKRLGITAGLVEPPPGIAAAKCLRIIKEQGGYFALFTINDPLHPFQADKEGPLNLVWPRPGTDKPANKYWKNQPLLDAMGRPARIADNCVDGPRGYVAQVHELLRAGVRDFLVKIVSPAKYQSPVRFALEENASDESIKAAFMDDFGWALIHIEDQKDCFFIQEHIDLGFEYRMIVVGGQVVAGAGAIDSFCPVDMVDPSAAFDPQVERKRNDGLVVLKDDLVASYAAFAADFAGAAAEASPNLVDYTLDLAVNLETEEIVV